MPPQGELPLATKGERKLLAVIPFPATVAPVDCLQRGAIQFLGHDLTAGQTINLLERICHFFLEPVCRHFRRQLFLRFTTRERTESTPLASSLALDGFKYRLMRAMSTSTSRVPWW